VNKYRKYNQRITVTDKQLQKCKNHVQMQTGENIANFSALSNKENAQRNKLKYCKNTDISAIGLH
jgi:hypothetical protein